MPIVLSLDENIAQTRDSVGIEQAIGIEDEQHVAARLRGSAVAAGAEAEIASVADDADARIAMPARCRWRRPNRPADALSLTITSTGSGTRERAFDARDDVVATVCRDDDERS